MSSANSTVFVTVGSTKFDALIENALEPAFLSACAKAGCKELVLQVGTGAAPRGLGVAGGDHLRRIKRGSKSGSDSSVSERGRNDSESQSTLQGNYADPAAGPNHTQSDRRNSTESEETGPKLPKSSSYVMVENCVEDVGEAVGGGGPMTALSSESMRRRHCVEHFYFDEVQCDNRTSTSSGTNDTIGGSAKEEESLRGRQHGLLDLVARLKATDGLQGEGRSQAVRDDNKNNVDNVDGKEREITEEDFSRGSVGIDRSDGDISGQDFEQVHTFIVDILEHRLRVEAGDSDLTNNGADIDGIVRDRDHQTARGQQQTISNRDSDLCGSSKPDLQGRNLSVFPKPPRRSTHRHTLRVKWFRFTTKFDQVLQQAGVVISHAGAGSILDALRKDKR